MNRLVMGCFSLALAVALFTPPATAQDAPPLVVVPTVFVPPEPAATVHPAEPEPLDSPNEWINRVRAPRESHRDGLEGIAQFKLSIDEAGRVSDCTLTRGTGHPSLDEVVCLALESHGRFRPATDAAGNNIAGEYEGVHEFEIQRRQIPQAVMAHTEMTIGVDGRASDCEVRFELDENDRRRDIESMLLRRTPREGADDELSKALCEETGWFVPYRNADGEVVPVRVINHQVIEVRILEESGGDGE